MLARVLLCLLSLLIGSGTGVAVLVFAMGGERPPVVGVTAVGCVLVCAVAVAATRAWPRHWWLWGIPAAAPTALLTLMFIGSLPGDWADMVTWGSVALALYCAGLAGGWMAMRWVAPPIQ